MPLTLSNQMTELEKIFLQLLRLAFQKRLAPVADLAALAAAPVDTTREGALRYVTAESVLYQFAVFSGAAHAPPLVVQPSGSTKPGRWLRVDVPWTYGPNGNRPLKSQQTGLCKAVELFQGADTGEALLKVFEARPSMFLTWEQSKPEPLSIYAGAHYKIVAPFTVMVACENLRPGPWALLGGAPAGQQDPGLHYFQGELLKVLAGVDLATPGIESVEIGTCDVVMRNLQERMFVGTVQFEVRCYAFNSDEDLETCRIDVHPNQADVGDRVQFDPLNFVAAGYTVTPGPGLARSYPAGLATIAGVSISSTPVDRTFSPSKDTYRDLKPDGTLTYLEVDVGAPPPAVTAGALRVGVTRTDPGAIISDHFICASSVQFYDTMVIP